MKYNIFKGLLAFGAIATLAGCSENSWNNEYLDDFEAPEVTTPAEAFTVKLTEADYSSIATASTVINYFTKQNPDMSASKVKEQLNNWAKLGYFTDAYPANVMLPLYFADYTFPYFAASDKSSLTVTYKEQIAANPVTTAIYKGKVYAVSTDDYKGAWGTPNAFTDAFTPATPASKFLPGILKTAYPDAEAGAYVLVNYNQADVEPTFESVTLTDINKVKVGNACTIDGYVTAICAQGYILTDATGSLLVYYGKEFKADEYTIGMQIQVSGKGSQYNGGLQLAPEAGKENIVSSKVYTYPTPVAMDGAKMNELRDVILANGTNGTMATYVEFSAEVTSTGNYTNFKVAGGETTGSAYQPTDATKKMFVKGETAAIKGYMISVNTDKNTKAPTYVNFIVTEVNGKATAAMGEDKPFVPAPAPIDSHAANALYTFNGTAWAAASDIYLISPEQMSAMGSTSGYIANAVAEANIPVLLKQVFPYASEGDSKLVAYQSGKAYANCMQFDYNGTEWVKYDNLETKTDKYAKVNGEWIFNPNVFISIPNVRQSEPGLTFYQTTVDWVNANEGSGYIDRGNSEFFSGCSAYYCNVNHDISQVTKYAPTMYPDLSQNVVIPLMRERFLNITMPATLKALYPEADLIDGYSDPIVYEIDYVTYYGSNAFEGKSGNVNDTVRYQVTGPAEFKLIYSTWLGGAVSAE